MVKNRWKTFLVGDLNLIGVSLFFFLIVNFLLNKFSQKEPEAFAIGTFFIAFLGNYLTDVTKVKSRTKWSRFFHFWFPKKDDYKDYILKDKDKDTLKQRFFVATFWSVLIYIIFKILFY